MVDRPPVKFAGVPAALLAVTGSRRVRGPNLRAVLAALPSNECVDWPGRVNRQGYGRVDGSRTKIAHLHVYRLVVGEVPPGLELDHTCRRAICGSGHPLTDDNLYISPAGVRYCRPCRRAYDATRRPRHKETAVA